MLLFVSVSEDAQAADSSMLFGDGVQIRKSCIRSKPGWSKSRLTLMCYTVLHCILSIHVFILRSENAYCTTEIIDPKQI